MLADYFLLSYPELKERVRDQQLSPALPLINLTVLRNVMLEPIEIYWKYLFQCERLQVCVKFGQYDQIFSEAVGGNTNILNEKTDVVMVFFYLETFSENLSRRFAELNRSEIDKESSRIQEFVETVLAGIRRQTQAVIIWHGLERPIYPAMGVVEAAYSRHQTQVIQSLNDKIRDLLHEAKNAYFVDLETCRARIGGKSFYDMRYWHIGHAPYSREAYREIAFEDFKYIRAIKGKNKKCLVMDCDNTLWGGIIGEDGLSKIQIAKTSPGVAYYELQQEILNLYHRGIILALCSKNNEKDVQEVFRSHPDMVLKQEHIASARINWEDKVTNLLQISEELNISLNSMVFMDDNEFELGLVRRHLPEVELISLAGQSPADYRCLLASCGLFDSLTLTEEDRQRGRMYKADVERKKMAASIVNMESYLRSLEMTALVRFADEFSVPRVSQLTQRTNQFNLTTRRYTEDDIRILLKDNTVDILTLNLKDRFGDFGMVGVCILRYVAKKAKIDTLLLSCRALGRQAEKVILMRALQLAKSKGLHSVTSEFRPTAGNALAQDFYPQNGFQVIKEDAGHREYEIVLSGLDIIMPEEFAHIET